MRILCFWPNYSGDKVPVIDFQIRQAIESSGGIIEVDEYPQRHRIIGPEGDERDVWI
jgi:hypothetical protein